MGYTWIKIKDFAVYNFSKNDYLQTSVCVFINHHKKGTEKESKELYSFDNKIYKVTSVKYIKYYAGRYRILYQDLSETLVSFLLKKFSVYERIHTCNCIIINFLYYPIKNSKLYISYLNISYIFIINIY